MLNQVRNLVPLDRIELPPTDYKTVRLPLSLKGLISGLRHHYRGDDLQDARTITFRRSMGVSCID